VSKSGPLTRARSNTGTIMTATGKSNTRCSDWEIMLTINQQISSFYFRRGSLTASDKETLGLEIHLSLVGSKNSSLQLPSVDASFNSKVWNNGF